MPTPSFFKFIVVKFKPLSLSAVRYPSPMLFQGLFTRNTAPYPQNCLITHRRAADSDVRPPVPIYS